MLTLCYSSAKRNNSIGIGVVYWRQVLFFLIRKAPNPAKAAPPSGRLFFYLLPLLGDWSVSLSFRACRRYDDGRIIGRIGKSLPDMVGPGH